MCIKYIKLVNKINVRINDAHTYGPNTLTPKIKGGGGGGGGGHTSYL